MKTQISIRRVQDVTLVLFIVQIFMSHSNLGVMTYSGGGIVLCAILLFSEKCTERTFRALAALGALVTLGFAIWEPITLFRVAYVILVIVHTALLFELGGKYEN